MDMPDIVFAFGWRSHAIQPLKLDPENSFFDEVLGWTIAAGGAYFQVNYFTYIWFEC